MRIVLTGGGSGGHALPFTSLISSLRTHFLQAKEGLPKFLGKRDLDLYFFGVANDSIRALFAGYSVPTISIPSGKLRRYASALTITDLLFRLPLGLFIALFHLYRIMPDVVISQGGYGSIPTVLAAAFYRIPVLLHEYDAVPGLANRRLARFATAITAGFAPAAKHFGKYQHKVVVTGSPAREGLARFSKAEAKKRFGFAADDHVLLIMGGSQGAQQINEMVLQILPTLVLDAAIIHITGEKNFAVVSKVAQEILAQSSQASRYKPFAYLREDMDAALAAADSVVARAGAGTITEIVHLRIPSLFIPLPTAAQDHQRRNAQVLETAGAAIVLDPNNLKRHLFEKNIERLIKDEATRLELKQNMGKLDKPQAAAAIAELAFNLAQGLAPVEKE